MGLDDLQRDQDSAYGRAIAAMCDGTPRVDALFVPIELAAVFVLETLLRRGLRVPHDIMLATTSDTGRGLHTSPQLTTLEWNYQELGREATNLLLDLIDGAASAPCEIVVPTTLATRASTQR